MPSVSTLTRGNFTQHRKALGAPVAPDSADLTLIPIAAGLRTEGVTRVIVAVKLAGGAAPNVTLQPLLYDADSSTWYRRGNQTGLVDGDLFEVDVHELPLFLRIHAVNNAPTSVEIRVAPGDLSAHA